MDNLQLVRLGPHPFKCRYKIALRSVTRAVLYCSAGVCASYYVHADSIVKHSTIALSAQQNYITQLPTEFNKEIPFHWRYIPTSDRTPSAMGYSWRHSYHIRLLKNQDKLELLNPNGTRQLFLPIDAHNYVADNSPSETIEHKQNRYRLITPVKTTVFFGSYPVEIKTLNTPAIKLRYKNGVLSRLFNNKGSTLLLDHDNNGALTRISQTDGASVTFEYDQYSRLSASRSANQSNRFYYPTAPPVMLCTASTTDTQLQPQKQPSDQSCNVSDNPPPSSFQLSQPARYSVKIDLRPQSCRSYFVDYNGIDRGVKLEAGMQTHARYTNLVSTVRSFPVVDFIDGREAVAVYTKDLTSKAYNPISQPDGLYQSIIQDAQKADDKFLNKLKTQGFVSAKDKGITTTISNTQVDALRMEVMIQAGVATPSQLAQIEQARLTLLATSNIKLVTVLIP